MISTQALMFGFIHICQFPKILNETLDKLTEYICLFTCFQCVVSCVKQNICILDFFNNFLKVAAV